MNSKALPSASEVPERRISLFGCRCKLKVFVAVILSVFSFFLMFFLGEGFGDYATFIGMGAYFLICQYLLSHGNPQALRKDWSSIVALNFSLLISTIICLAIEPNKGAKLETLCLAILPLACSYAGAALAAKTAHRA